MNTLPMRGGCRWQPPLITKVFIFEPGSVRYGFFAMLQRTMAQIAMKASFGPIFLPSE